MFKQLLTTSLLTLTWNLSTIQAGEIPPICPNVSHASNQLLVKNNSNNKLATVYWSGTTEMGATLQPSSGVATQNMASSSKLTYDTCRGKYWTGSAQVKLKSSKQYAPFATVTVTNSCKLNSTTGQYNVEAQENGENQCVVTVN